MRNHTQLIGRLGADPVLKPTQGDTVVTTLRVAVDDRKGNADWFYITVFGKQAELCVQKLQKGELVGCSCRLKPRQWEQDGETRYRTEIIAHHVDFLR